MRDVNLTATVRAVLVALVFVMSVLTISTGLALAEDSPPPDKVVVDKTAADPVKADSAKIVEPKAKTEEAKPQIKGSDKKGKYFFKKTCKSCHAKKGDGGDITPISKTIKQWQRFFRKDTHTEKKLSEEYDAEQLIHIKTFLMNHATDSDQPETCG